MHLSKRATLMLVLSLAAVLVGLLWHSAVYARTPLQQGSSTADLIPLYAIQGDAATSPYYQEWIDTYGVVTAVTNDGYYLQDPVGDGNPDTSDGIFVYTQRPPTVTAGECVLLQRAFVDEYYEKTELSRTKAPVESDLCAPTALQPVPISAARLATEPAQLFEEVEGMLVQIDDLTGMAQGGIKRFADGAAEIAFLPTEWVPYVAAGRVFQHDAKAVSALMYLGSELGAALPEVNRGDQILLGAEPGADDAVVGVLDYNFGKYQFLPLAGSAILSRASTPATPAAPEAGGQADATPVAPGFTICTFNLLGMGQGSAQYRDDDEYDAQLAKRALAIAQELDGCTIIGVQETGTPDDAANLADLLTEEYGLPYTATAIEGPGTSSYEFPLTNSVLTRTDQVTVINAELRQGCSSFNYDVKFMSGVCERGTYGLFNRPPLVVDLTVDGAWGDPVALTVIDNHWKSKGGDETVNVVRRTAQAQHVASLAQEKLAQDPAANVVVLGDLNDYYASAPVETLRTGVVPPLVHSYDFLPRQQRYTYIFNGASQVLDHILTTSDLAAQISEVRPIRINADFAYPLETDAGSVHHSSDHDPVLVRVQPGKAAWLGGNLRYPAILVTVVDQDGATLGQTVTDADGDFRVWNLTPGAVAVKLSAPAAVVPREQTLELLLQDGANDLAEQLGAPIPFVHGATATGAAAALFLPEAGTLAND